MNEYELQDEQLQLEVVKEDNSQHQQQQEKDRQSLIASILDKLKKLPDHLSR